MKSDHKLHRRNGTALTADRLTQATVVDLDYKPGLDRYFDALVVAAGPAWNDAVVFAREISQELRASTDPAVIEDQASRLQKALADLQQEVRNTKRNLDILAQTIGQPMPAAASLTLAGLNKLVETAEVGYSAFLAEASTSYQSPSALGDQKRLFAKLRQASGLAAEVAQVKHYLDAAQLRSSDQELIGEKLSLRGRMSLDSLLSQPEQWAAILDSFDSFKRNYRNTYQKHHRDVQTEMGKLQNLIQEVPRRLRALTLLNGIEDLGEPVASDLPSRFEGLRTSVRTCPVPVGSLTMENAPTCNTCNLSLTLDAPKTEVDSFLRDLDRALTDQQRRLASEAIKRVLSKSTENSVVKFVHVVQSANLASLVDVMSEELVEFIRVLLLEEETAAVRADVLQRFVYQYPTLDEADLPNAVRAFEKLLRDAFAEARATGPDKKTVRLMLQ